MGNEKDDGHTHYAGCSCHEAEWERRLKELRVVIEDAIDILDGNKEPIDWRDRSQPELLRKLCEALDVRPNPHEGLYGKMLGQIASLVSDWCGPHHTTLDGVKLLLADWHHLRAAQLEESVPEE